MDRDSDPTVAESMLPAAPGTGSSDTCDILFQLASLIVEVEYRISYVAAVPVTPSSPGAVQCRLTVLSSRLYAHRSVIAEGGFVSGDGSTVLSSSEHADTINSPATMDKRPE